LTYLCGFILYMYVCMYVFSFYTIICIYIYTILYKHSNKLYILVNNSSYFVCPDYQNISCLYITILPWMLQNHVSFSLNTSFFFLEMTYMYNLWISKLFNVTAVFLHVFNSETKVVQDGYHFVCCLSSRTSV
jgi:hypothetical protein